LIKILQLLKSNSPVSLAIIRDVKNSLLVYLKVYLELLETLSLEYNKDRKRIANYTNTFNNRDLFSITWVY
jgi:hypothetical protein